MRKRFLVFAIALAFLSGWNSARAQKVLAPTPPMGWNSWDSYGLTIDEQQFRANVEVMATRLKSVGYQYAVVDEGWYLLNPQRKKGEAFLYRTDRFGRYQPALNRYAGAKDDIGFKPVSDYVHSRGLKFGIHIIRGIPKQAVAQNTSIAASNFHASDAADTTDTCPWNPDNYGVKDNAAGQAWYDALIKQYAAWGIDYIKVDCISSHPYKGDEIRMIHRAIVKSGRPIVLSLSPGPAPLDKAEELAANAQLWRISADMWDRWERPSDVKVHQFLKDQFAVIASWVPHVKPGSWPDADMLPLGTLEPVPGWGKPRKTDLTPDEQKTLITLWSIARSPLFIGANLTELDDETARLLTNPEVIAMDQHGHDQHVLFQHDNLVAWTSKSARGTQYLALFNLGETPRSVIQPLSDFG
ncbi:MAG TPA: glycoside hydrolase family 27 protein, partial [Edaphobacter sp.]|nr:glycoside hydrolase family 27 protein [Edaphobacter sp.]